MEPLGRVPSLKALVSGAGHHSAEGNESGFDKSPCGFRNPDQRQETLSKNGHASLYTSMPGGGSVA